MDKLSRYLVASPFVRLEEEAESSVVVFATRSGAVYRMPRASWEALSGGDVSVFSAQEIAELRDAEILVPQEEDELRAVLDRNRHAIASNRRLNYVIQPSAQCQLGCGYCGQQHSSGQLSDESEAGIVADIERRLASGTFEVLNLCWFGAEPLAGMRRIRSLTPRVRRAAEAAGCRYRASIITNGLGLSRSIAEELVNELDVISVTISLDGTAAFHDRRRHTKAGRPTFDRILANLTGLADVVRDRDDVEIKVRCNVDRENADGVVPLLRQLAASDLQRRITFYVAPIHAWGNDAHLRSLSPEAFADLEIGWFVEMAALGYQTSLIPSVQRIVCLAVQPEGTLVDARGNLFNCTEVSYVPAYGDPNVFAIGHLGTGETAGRRQALGDFNDRVEAGLYDCGRCPMLPVCGGACPKEWADGHKPCPSAKENMPERLLLAVALPRIAASRAAEPEPVA